MAAAAGAKAVSLLTTLVTAGELAVKAGDVAKEVVPKAPSGLQEKHRWAQLTIKNQTQFTILLNGKTYFDSGRYWTAPGSIGGFQQSVFSICNGDNTILTGVSGGTPYRLSLDDQHFFDFALGWTSPQFGAFKASAIASGSAEAGYNAASENGGAIQSADVYSGKDKTGKEIKFRVHVSAAPGQEMLYVVNQVIVN